MKKNCHFFIEGKYPSCKALKALYNTSDCGECPFFKTKEQFWEGWKHRI